MALFTKIYFLNTSEDEKVKKRSLLLTLELQTVSITSASVQETVDIRVEEAVVCEDLVEVDVVVDAAVGHASHGT